MTTRKQIIYHWQEKGLEDLKGERWGDIPWLDGAYQLSTFGRIKSLQRWVETGVGGYWTENRILTPMVRSQFVTKGRRRIDRLTISLTVEGKKHPISISRLVYYLFVKKFDLSDRSLVVSPVDENGLNVTLENLQLTTPSKNIVAAYNKKRRPRTSFGHNARVVSQFDLAGNWVATYLSISQAAQKTGVSGSSICEALADLRLHGGSFLWRLGRSRKKFTVAEKIRTLVAARELYATVVIQFDFHGKKVREYENLKEAAKTMKVKPTQIRSVLLGRRLSLKGYYWKLGSCPATIVISGEKG